MFRRLYRAVALLLSAAMLLGFAACSAAPVESTPSPSPTPESSVAAEAAASRGYVITIPESVLRLLDTDITALARRLELDTVTILDNGSCSIQLTESERDTVCTTLRESLDAQLAALPENGTWPFLDSVTLDAKCQNATLMSEKARYSPVRDNAVAQAVYIPALLYTVFSGGDPEAYTLHFTVLDRDGKTVLGEFDYPKPEPSPSPEVTTDTDE